MLKKTISLVLVALTVLVASTARGDVVGLGPIERARRNAERERMQIERQRERVVDFMRATASIEWTPAEDIEYWSAKQNFKFKKGETYRGVPYTQLNRDYDLNMFKGTLKDVDGVMVYTGPTDAKNYCGSDCSSTVSHAWRQVETDFPTLSTDQMFPEKNKRIACVGDYKVTDGKSTYEIVKANGKEKMFDAYAELKPGDAVLTRRATGHVMLVVANDPKSKTIKIIDQTGCDDGVPMGQNGTSTMRIDHEQTYERLFNNGYIPIQLKRFVQSKSDNR